LKTLTNFFDQLVRKYLPDAFLFAIILTLVVFVLGMVVMGHSPVDMVQYWGEGFWELLSFSMQMSLVVVTGYVLANTPTVKKGLYKISSLAKTPGQAILLVTFVSIIACLINYGFGLIVGALLAVHVAKRVPTADYRVLIAGAYSAFLVWHGGFSGSIPLTIATPGHFLEKTIGVIPVTETLFSSYNIFIVVVLLVTLPLLNWYIMKTRDPIKDYDARIFQAASMEPETAEEPVAKTDMYPADKLENSRIISLIIGLLGLAYIVYHFVTKGFDLNINIVNFIMFFLGILLHRTPRRFLDSVADGVKNAGGIIIQFPFYAGIMGMMTASGLSAALSTWFVHISNETTLPLLTFISAGIVNVFVPSGGGQWAVQGPIMIPAALQIGADTAKTAMAIAWGDAWTNMIQPFWALPLLAIAGLKIRDIMGFCVIALFYSFIPIAIAMLFL